jgi:hypothetical protein
VTQPPAEVFQYPDPPIPVNWPAIAQADAIAVRDALATVTRRWQYVGVNPAEVGGEVYNAYEALNTLASVYSGAALPSPRNFDNETAPVRRGG